MKKINIFICSVICSIAFAKDYLEITPEIGVITGINYLNQIDFKNGAYGRLWFVKNSFAFAPSFKWEESKTTNFKTGFLIGGEVKDFVILYGGANYSYRKTNFIDKNGFGAEIGSVFFMPYFSIGIFLDYSYHRESNHIFGGGLSFGIPF